MPLDPTPILKKLRLYKGRQTVESDASDASDASDMSAPHPPRTPTQEPSFSEWTTPLTLRTRKKGSDYIKRRNANAIANIEPITPSVLRVF